VEQDHDILKDAMLFTSTHILYLGFSKDEMKTRPMRNKTNGCVGCSILDVKEGH
jgi:hypothetical protein